MAYLFVFGVVVALAAYIGSRFKPDLWYHRIHKPGWNPPNWVFGPVWTVLYAAIAFAGWLVWWANADTWSLALTFWSMQLILNVIWTWLFFERHALGAALIDSGLLLLAIIAFIVTAPEYSPFAAWLFVPYAVWAAFACFLTYTIWKMNRAPSHRMNVRRSPGYLD